MPSEKEIFCERQIAYVRSCKGRRQSIGIGFAVDRWRNLSRVSAKCNLHWNTNAKVMKRMMMMMAAKCPTYEVNCHRFSDH